MIKNYQISLGGEWILSSEYLNQKVQATVPGSIYHDLLKSKRIPDPFDQDYEYQVRDIMNYDFTFEKEFTLHEEDITKNVNLVCKGIDTLAKIYINNEFLAHVDDMHRTWKFNVRNFLKVGQNHLKIMILSPLVYIKEKSTNAKEKLFGVKDAVVGYNYLRKGSSMFGWDWGPQLPDGGIFKEIYLDCFDQAEIESVLIHQNHHDDEVTLDLKTECILYDSTMSSLIDYQLYDENNQLIHESQKELTAFNTKSIIIKNPHKWYPIGYGEQPLYRLQISIIMQGVNITSITKKIGLREMTVSQISDEFGESFTIICNQIPIFAKGANYIPEDNLLPRTSKELTEDLLVSARNANHNMIRVWGGGIYPEDYFYDLCDELGLMVWQDLMFACSVYDMSDERFVENITNETIDNLKRIRHHACIALVCGNNENETAIENWNVPSKELSKAYFVEQYMILLPEIVKNTYPDVFYWRSSPSSKDLFVDSNSDAYGDMHYWGVWHSNEPITYYRRHFPRFMSEFGLQSFPSLKTVKTFTKEEDRNIFSYIMESHQKNSTANGKILHYISEMFQYPKDFDSLLYISQLIQAEGVRYGSEHFRRIAPRCMGILYWQLNDCWPVASWSSVDYYHRFKALYYHSKKFYQPILISIEEQDQKAHVVLCNDTLSIEHLTYRAEFIDFDGTIIFEEQFDLDMNPQTVLTIKDYEFHYSKKEFMNYVLHVSVSQGNVEISSNQVSFVPDKYLKLKKPRIQYVIELIEKDQYQLILTSNTYAKYIEVDFDEDTRFSDMYFHLYPNQPKAITFHSQLTKDELSTKLKIRSLVDSY